MTRKRYFVAQGIVGILGILSVLLGGCTDKDSSFGADLLPQNDLLFSYKVEETASISAFTFHDDTILVSNVNPVIFGSFNDPLLGQTNAGFATQFRLLANPEFNDGDIIDSMVLVMQYKDIYGDTLTPQTVNVYELQDTLDSYGRYYSSYDLKEKKVRDSSPIGTKIFTPKLRINYNVQESGTTIDTTIQEIRVSLDKNLGQKFIDADSTIYENNDEFLDFFKGLYIEPIPVNNKGTLLKISPSTSRVYFHYKDEESVSKVRWINVTENSAVISSFSHSYANTAFEQNMNQEVNQDSLVFIKPNAGTRVKVNITTLDKWKDSTDCVINKAVVTFHVDALISDLRRFTPPQNLFLKYNDATDKELFLDDIDAGILYFGGFYNSIDATYSFNIAGHLQKIINEGNDDPSILGNSLYLVHSDRRNSFERVILKSSNSSRPIELEITYTKYK